MKSRDPITAFDAFLNETHVGELSYIAASNTTTFILAQGYIEQEDRPILSQSYRNKTGGIGRTKERTMVSIPAFFSNLLPDEGPLRDLIVKRGKLKGTNEFELLSFLREDLPGAIRLRPVAGQTLPTNVESAWETEPKGKTKEDSSLRFSLAGVQLKFSGSFREKRLTIPASGTDGDWIIKVPNNQFPYSSENEFATMTLAKELGIDVPPILLIDAKEIDGLVDQGVFSEGQCYAIKRFDRTDSDRRIHIEDFAQVFNVQPKHKYDDASYRDIASVIWQQCGEAGIVQFIKRLVLSIVVGNLDMHLKNWSLIYQDPCQASIAPAYDLMSTVVYPGYDKKLALSLSATKHPNEIGIRNFQKLAAKAGLPEALILTTVEDTARSIGKQWSDFRKLFPKQHLSSLESYMESVPLFAMYKNEVVGSAPLTKKPIREMRAAGGWLEAAIEQEFAQVRPALESIRRELKKAAKETSWEISTERGSVKGSFQANTITVLISFGGWTNPQGSKLELMPKKDFITIVSPRGPHMVARFEGTNRIDRTILGFKYIIYNGRPGWESLTPSPQTSPFLNTEQLIRILLQHIESLTGTDPADEECRVEFEYLTRSKVLVSVRDHAHQLRGSSILTRRQATELATHLMPDNNLDIPTQSGDGAGINRVSLSILSKTGLVGKFPTERDREIIGKEIISERLKLHLDKYFPGADDIYFWQDNENGARLVLKLNGKANSLDFAIREILGMVSDRAMYTKVDGQLYLLVRELDDLYRKSISFLLSAGGKTRFENIPADILAFMLEEHWVEKYPKLPGYTIRTEGTLETLKFKRFPVAPTPGRCASCGKAISAADIINTPSKGSLCIDCFNYPKR